MFAETRFRNASVVALIVGLHLTVPKISELTTNFTDLTSSDPRAVAINGETKIEINSQNLDKNNDLDEEFQPPNYGGPDSERGSGTR